MSEFITSLPNHFTFLEPQPQFPKTDVSEQNIPYLEFILSNQETRTIAHETAEQASRMFTMAHIVLTKMHKWANFSEQDSHWIGVGVAQYEAISGLLRNGEDNSHLNSIATPYGLQRRIKTNDYDKYFTEAYQDFYTTTPNLEGLIADVTSKTTAAPRSVVELALYGAAIQRKNELDALATKVNQDFDAITGVEDILIPTDSMLDRIFNQSEIE